MNNIILKQEVIMKKVLIAVDPGKYMTKGLSESKRVSFRSKLMLNDMGIEPQGNSYAFEFDRKNYLVGDLAEEQNFDVSKTNIVHKLCTYVAISQLVPSGEAVQLVIGCPVSVYKNKDLREQYKEFILNQKYISLRFIDKRHYFIFDNILVLPEGSGVVYLYPNLFKNKRAAVVDIGGLNMNFTVYDNLTPELSSMFTLNHGGNELETQLINRLNSKYGTNIELQNAKYILKDNGLKVKGNIDPFSVSIVDGVVKGYLNRIFQEIKRNNHNVDTMEVVFIGGTSTALKDNIEKALPHAVVVDDAQWSNVEGFLRIGALKFE
jgi:plasmid segregation protein ParM